jgi:hypothetical protein
VGINSGGAVERQIERFGCQTKRRRKKKKMRNNRKKKF